MPDLEDRYGLAAFGQGGYEEAIRRLEPLDGQLVRVGGSHAQWEVFEDTLLQADLRAGQCERAEALVCRCLNRCSSARDVPWLGQATAGQASEAVTQASGAS